MHSRYSRQYLYSSLYIFFCQCFPGCLTIQIRTALCILIVLLIYAVAQACVVSVNATIKKCHLPQTTHLTGQPASKKNLTVFWAAAVPSDLTVPVGLF